MLLRIGSCSIDSDRRRLLRDGTERHLPPKAFDLFLALIDARPKVLTKEQLIGHIWPDSFVSDANLAVLVGDIRAAIGDSARSPRFIKTHHGVGYSFIGKVSEVARVARPVIDGPIFVLEMGPRRVFLAEGTHTVGRDNDCDIVLPHRSVSRLHARLQVAGATLVVEDAGSKNGVRVNGVRVTMPRVVLDGEGIVFGSVKTTIAVEPADSSTLSVRDSDSIT